MKKRIKSVITIHDVADAAGVSISTVSRVLNNKDDVAPETSDRVKGIIQELGYTTNLAARSMRSRRTNVIGLVMTDVGDPFSVQVLRGVDRAIAELAYDLIVYTGGVSREKLSADQERRYVSLLDSSITDGVIVVAPTATTFSTVSPIVVIDPNKENPDYPAVIATNRDGVLEAMEYLIHLGHRRIGFIGGRPELQSAVQRLQGYQDGLCQANIPLDPELVRVGDYSKKTGYLCAQRLLNLPDRPTAIFASNDQSALGLLEAAEEIGLHIPDDLSVVGFDNIPESAYSSPPLTTIDQFITEMGAMAIEMLVKLVKGETLECNLRLIHTQLIVRDSCASMQCHTPDNPTGIHRVGTKQKNS
jgi:LacI family transcriptional regulator